MSASDDAPGTETVPEQEAEPSATEPAAKSADEELKEADEQFKLAMRLRLDDPVQAANLFSRVLEVRVKRYGKEALECAEAYRRYGMALVDVGRNSTDFLGEDMQQVAQHADVAVGDLPGKGKTPVPPTNAPGTSAGPSTSEAEANRKGKDGGEGDEEDEVEEDGGSDDEEDAEEEDEGQAAQGEDGADEGAEDGSDMAIAWDALEIARNIYEQHSEGGKKFNDELADIHVALGDIAAEAGLETAALDYDRGIEALSRMVPEDPRRLAEAHFKQCIALQMIADRPEDSLAHCRRALTNLSKGLRQLEEKLEEIGRQEANGDGSAAARGEAILQEVEGIEEVMGDLKDKEEELIGICKSNASMKHALKSAMLMAAAQEKGRGQGGASGAAAASATQPSNAPMPGPSAAAKVQDLGVAGRGRSRITLQPVASDSKAPAGTTGTGTGAALAKRTLEDLLGGSSGDGVTTIGFGSAAKGHTANLLPAGPDLLGKRLKVSEPAAAQPPANASAQQQGAGAAGADQA